MGPWLKEWDWYKAKFKQSFILRQASRMKLTSQGRDSYREGHPSLFLRLAFKGKDHVVGPGHAQVANELVIHRNLHSDTRWPIELQFTLADIWISLSHLG